MDGRGEYGGGGRVETLGRGGEVVESIWAGVVDILDVDMIVRTGWYERHVSWA